MLAIIILTTHTLSTKLHCTYNHTTTNTRAHTHTQLVWYTSDCRCILCSCAGGSRGSIRIQKRMDPVRGTLPEILEEQRRISLHQAKRADFLDLGLGLRLIAW